MKKMDLVSPNGGESVVMSKELETRISRLKYSDESNDQMIDRLIKFYRYKRGLSRYSINPMHKTDMAEALPKLFALLEAP